MSCTSRRDRPSPTRKAACPAFRPGILIGLSLLLGGRCSAQPDSGIAVAPVLSMVVDDGERVLQAAGRVMAAPVNWSAGDWLLAGGVGGATVAGFGLDTKVSDLMERNHSSFNDHATDVAVEYGSGAVAIGVPVGLYLSGLVLEDRWLRETGLLAGAAMVMTSATTTLGKVIIGRARPYEGRGHAMFLPFDGRDAFMSFPSGHTTAAFSLSAVLAARIKNPWATVTLYGVAAGAAASRMYTRDHWLSDVIFAAAYSSAVAHSLVVRFEEEKQAAGADPSFMIVPAGDGVRLVWRW